MNWKSLNVYFLLQRLIKQILSKKNRICYPFRTDKLGDSCRNEEIIEKMKMEKNLNKQDHSRSSGVSCPSTSQSRSRSCCSYQPVNISRSPSSSGPGPRNVRLRNLFFHKCGLTRGDCTVIFLLLGVVAFGCGYYFTRALPYKIHQVAR